MEYDKSIESFELSRAEIEDLGLDFDQQIWPLEHAPALLKLVEAQRERIIGRDLSERPAGAQRSEMAYHQRRSLETCKKVIDVIRPFLPSLGDEAEEFLRQHGTSN